MDALPPAPPQEEAPIRPRIPLPFKLPVPGAENGGGNPEEGSAPRPPLLSFRAAGGAVMAMNALKPLGATSTKKVIFSEKELATQDPVQWKMAADARLRDLDALKMYKPLEEECDKLNIPDDRIDTCITKNVLLLCGGFAGARFTSDDFSQLFSICKQVSSSYDALVSKFNLLSSQSRRRKLKGGPYNESDLTSLLNSVDSQDQSSTSTSTPTPTPTPTTSSTINEGDRDASDVISFHLAADTFVSSLLPLIAFVKKKQSEIPSDRQAIKIDKDPEASLGKKMPDWLSILIAKYQNMLNTNDRPTIGKLSALISCCIVHSIPYTLEEMEAIKELLLASNDTHAHYTGHEEDEAHMLSMHSQKYWAQRVYDFLTHVSELKTYIKDEKSLFAFDAFYKF